MNETRTFYNRFANNSPDKHVNTVVSLLELGNNIRDRISLGRRLAHLSTSRQEAFQKLVKSRLRYGLR